MGSPKFVHNNLRVKLQKLSEEKDIIISFPDKQVRNLIFRWSFCAKVNHLLRTIPPYVMAEFVSSFNLLKKEIVCSLINDPDYPAHNYDINSLPLRVWQQVQLHLN